MIIHLRHPLHECPALAEIIGYSYDGEKVVGKLLQFADGHTVALKYEEIEELQEGLILPEEQLRATAGWLLDETWGSYEAAELGHDLAEMIIDYLDGLLTAVELDTREGEGACNNGHPQI
jgi:hypothetical protein